MIEIKVTVGLDPAAQELIRALIGMTAKEAPKPTLPEPEVAKPVDWEARRAEVRQLCGERRSQGVDIPAILADMLGTGAKFSQLPNDRLEEFARRVEAA